MSHYDHMTRQELIAEIERLKNTPDDTHAPPVPPVPDQGALAFHKTQSLQEREKMVNMLLNATIDSVVLLNPDGKARALNNIAAQRLGASVEDLLGNDVFSFMPPDVAASRKASFDEAVRTKTAIQFQDVRDGYSFETTFYPILAPDGAVEQVAVYARDITDQIHAQRNYQDLFSSMLDGFALHEIILDEHGAPQDYRFLALNPAFERLTGLLGKNVLGKRVREILPEIEDTWIQQFGAVALQGETISFENYNKDLDKHFRVTAYRPQPLQFACVFTDITALKKLSAELEDSRELFYKIFQLSPQPVGLTDAVTEKFIDVNDAFLETTKFRREDVIGKTTIDLNFFVDIKDRQKLFQERVKKGRVNNLEALCRKADGDLWSAMFSSVGVEVQGKKMFLTLADDITEAKLAEKNLIDAKISAEKASKAKTEFLANMSHELRTPLNGVMGMLQLIKLTSDNEEQTKHSDVAISACKRLTKLLGDILDLSKIEAGRVEIIHQPFSMQEVINSVDELFSPAAGYAGATLHTTLGPGVPKELIGDEQRIRQVLFNLVGNAIKFSPAGTIRVEAHPLPDNSDNGQRRILLTVSDNGIGIPDNKINDVFDSFYQGEATFTRQFQGAGLGLSITKRLVALMGGDICLDSTEGQGSTFYISLPVEFPKTRTPNTRPGAVLVVENDEGGRLTLERLLRLLHVSAVCVNDGEKALDALLKQDFDLILMDIQLPKMDGVTATRHIRNDPEFKDKAETPIIALTAYAMASEQETFLQAGLDGYLAKPFEVDELETIIDKFLP